MWREQQEAVQFSLLPPPYTLACLFVIVDEQKETRDGWRVSHFFSSAPSSCFDGSCNLSRRRGRLSAPVTVALLVSQIGRGAAPQTNQQCVALVPLRQIFAHPLVCLEPVFTSRSQTNK